MIRKLKRLIIEPAEYIQECWEFSAAVVRRQIFGEIFPSKTQIDDLTILGKIILLPILALFCTSLSIIISCFFLIFQLIGLVCVLISSFCKFVFIK